MHGLIAIAFLGACATDFDLEHDRDTAIAGPLDLDEPPEALEIDPIDEPDELLIDAAAAGDRSLVTTLRVLHWNIAGGKVHDCRTGGIAAAVRRLVRDHDIELVGLNEVCPDQYDAIRAELRQLWDKRPGAEFSAFVGDGKPRIVGNAIFSKRDLDRVTGRQLGTDRYGERNLLCGRIADRPHLRFCSTHLTPGDATARTQLARVRDELEQAWSEHRDTVVIAGDFNLVPSDRAFDAIYSADANHRAHNPNNRGHYRELDDNDAAHCRGYGERSTPNLDGGPCGDGLRIDMIFARQNRIHDLSYGADTLNVPTSCGGACSDHRPVRGRLRAFVRVE